MVMTADHDDRVVPAHSFKFISALQPAQQGDAPVLIRVQTQAGHGAGMPTSMIIDQQAGQVGLLLQYRTVEAGQSPLHHPARCAPCSPGERTG
jgi:prolyl oligopeptidase